jgi:hypothetical protein
MPKDPALEAFNEWAEDAMRRTVRMPSREEAFLAGWQYAVEFMESKYGRDERSQAVEVPTQG